MAARTVPINLASTGAGSVVPLVDPSIGLSGELVSKIVIQSARASVSDVQVVDYSGGSAGGVLQVLPPLPTSGHTEKFKLCTEDVNGIVPHQYAVKFVGAAPYAVVGYMVIR
jgi:hypothetical protein